MWIVNWISSSWLIILKKTSLSELHHIIKKWQLLIQIRWIGKKPVGQSNIFLVGLSNVHKCLLVIVLCHSVFLVWLWEGEWIVGLWPHYLIKPLMGISMVIFRRLASVKKKTHQWGYALQEHVLLLICSQKVSPFLPGPMVTQLHTK